MPVQTTFGQQSNPPAASGTGEGPVATGEKNEQLIAYLHAKHGYQTIIGQHYVAHLATAAAIPISTSTTFVLGLWNPGGTGKVVVPTRLNLGFTATTEVPGNIVISGVKNTGNTVATGAVILTSTAIVPTCALLGGGGQPSAQAFSAGTLTAAATIQFTTGLTQWTTPGTAVVATTQPRMYEFDGTFALAPGTLMLVMASAATGSTYTQSIFWYEQNIP